MFYLVRNERHILQTTTKVTINKINLVPNRIKFIYEIWDQIPVMYTANFVHDIVSWNPSRNLLSAFLASLNILISE